MADRARSRGRGQPRLLALAALRLARQGAARITNSFTSGRSAVKNEHAPWLSATSEVNSSACCRSTPASRTPTPSVKIIFGRSSATPIETAPFRYHETRYFWPFLLQGRGDDHYYNRWGPFYTHSIVKGRDKIWCSGRCGGRIRWNEAGLAQTKDQRPVLFLLLVAYRTQPRAPAIAAAARRTSLWPLFTVWDNGAGRRQVQVPSPFASRISRQTRPSASFTIRFRRPLPL